MYIGLEGINPYRIPYIKAMHLAEMLERIPEGLTTRITGAPEGLLVSAGRYVNAENNFDITAMTPLIGKWHASSNFRFYNHIRLPPILNWYSFYWASGRGNRDHDFLTEPEKEILTRLPKHPSFSFSFVEEKIDTLPRSHMLKDLPHVSVRSRGIVFESPFDALQTITRIYEGGTLEPSGKEARYQISVFEYDSDSNGLGAWVSYDLSLGSVRKALKFEGDMASRIAEAHLSGLDVKTVTPPSDTNSGLYIAESEVRLADLNRLNGLIDQVYTTILRRFEFVGDNNPVFYKYAYWAKDLVNKNHYRLSQDDPSLTSEEISQLQQALILQIKYFGAYSGKDVSEYWDLIRPIARPLLKDPEKRFLFSKNLGYPL